MYARYLNCKTEIKCYKYFFFLLFQCHNDNQLGSVKNVQIFYF